jgi:hypothetical protein
MLKLKSHYQKVNKKIFYENNFIDFLNDVQYIIRSHKDGEYKLYFYISIFIYAQIFKFLIQYIKDS